jgi:hypothetical protein
MKTILITLCIVLGITFAFTAREASAATFSKQVSSLGLLAWWRFDEGTSTVAHDYSGNSLNGSVVNVANPATASSGWGLGRRGASLVFDGTNDHVSVPHNALLKPASEITFSVWVKPDVGSLNSLREIYRKEDGGNRHLFAFQGPTAQCGNIGGTGGCISFGITTGGVYAEFDVPIAAADWEGRWSLVTAVYDGSTKKMYKDGVLASSTPATGAIGTAGSATGYIGSLSGVNEFFKGSIDDFRIYGRALSALEISTMYTQGQSVIRGVSAEGLLGWWRFDEGTSTVAHDFSGNGNTGSLIGSTSWVSGKRVGAIDFSGASNRMSASTTLSGIDTGSATYATWFKSGVSTSWQRIFHTGCGSYGVGMFMANNNASGKLSLGVCSGGVGGSFVPTTVSTYFDDLWHHAVAVIDRSAGTARIYVDGVNVPIAKNAGGECGTISGDTLSMDISSCGSATAFSGSMLSLGANDANGEQYGGLLDDTRIYTRALSASEVLSLYNQNSIVLQSTQSTQVTDGLVGYWSFNGKDVNWTSPTAGVAYDRSGQGNNGTFFNMSSTASPVAGKAGQAMSFNGGSSYITAAKPSGLTSTISVCLWAKWTSVGTGISTIQELVDNNHAGVPNRGFALQDRPDLGKVLTFSASPGVGAGGVASTFQVGDGTWRHICGTNDGSTSRLYIDGVLNNSLAETPNANYQPTVSFGRWLGGNRYLNGSMDETRLYNRAISASEVKQLYNLGR